MLDCLSNIIRINQHWTQLGGCLLCSHWGASTDAWCRPLFTCQKLWTCLLLSMLFTCCSKENSGVRYWSFTKRHFLHTVLCKIIKAIEVFGFFSNQFLNEGYQSRNGVTTVLSRLEADLFKRKTGIDNGLYFVIYESLYHFISNTWQGYRCGRRANLALTLELCQASLQLQLYHFLNARNHSLTLVINCFMSSQPPDLSPWRVELASFISAIVKYTEKKIVNSHF